MKRIFTIGRWDARKAVLAVSVLLLFSANAMSQQVLDPGQDSKQPAKEAKPADAKSAPKPAFTIAVKTKPILNLTLKAEKASLAEVTQELSKRLKTQVFLGPTLQKELISIEFSELTLEPALQLLAPVVYVDYEVSTASGVPPRALGIFLLSANQGEPPLSAVVPSSSESLLIEGDTEDGVEPTTDEAKKKLAEQPLRVQFQNNKLSIKAKKQPLPLVLLKIGEELGIPVDIQYQPTDLIDTEISKVSVEDAVRQLSPNIRLFLRADLARAERRALRLVLADPAKTNATGF